MANRLPLHELHVAAGGKFETLCGWELPQSYGDAAGEYAAARRRLGLVDRGDRGVLEVTGRDRAPFLHALVSNDVKSLGPGQGCAATLLDVHGKIQVILALLVLEDRILILTPPGMAEKTLAELDRFLFSEKAELRDATGEQALVLLVGPAAAATTEALTGEAPLETPWSHAPASLGGVDVRVARGARETGEDEVWVWAPAAEGPRLWDAALAAGARPIGTSAFESLRIEAGTPLFGHDAGPTVLLPEIPFATLVSDTKGCYPGQEVVVRIRDRGHVNRLFCGLLLDGENVPPAGAPVLVDGAEIGRVTSACWSFGRERPLALAFVRRQHADPGSRVAVGAGAEALPATVSALPFER
ncbi:MAG: aminomethyl transferase family protein [Candidatus Rokubacteria bacterium]|nr:aminomethyl transferase family protein [Candidatus Rokubacteria bacterium]